MGTLDKVRDLFDHDDRVFTYRCLSCDHEFESTEAHMGKVDCPECGKSQLRAV